MKWAYLINLLGKAVSHKFIGHGFGRDTQQCCVSWAQCARQYKLCDWEHSEAVASEASLLAHHILPCEATCGCALNPGIRIASNAFALSSLVQINQNHHLGCMHWTKFL